MLHGILFHLDVHVMWNVYHTHTTCYPFMYKRQKHFVKLLDDSQQDAVYSAKGSDGGSMRAKAA